MPEGVRIEGQVVAVEQDALVIDVKKTTDKASTIFFKDCVLGIHYENVVIAIRKAGSDAPSKIRDGLEDIPAFKGLLRDFTRPVFTRDRHDALLPEDLVMVRWSNGQMLHDRVTWTSPPLRVRIIVQDRVLKLLLEFFVSGVGRLFGRHQSKSLWH